MSRWYVQLTGDDPKGPYTTEEIADRVVAGALPPDAPVSPEGDEERYFPLDTLPEFGLAIREASTRPPRPRSNPPASRSNPPPARSNPPGARGSVPPPVGSIPPPPRSASSPQWLKDREMPTSPKSFRPVPLASLGHASGEIASAPLGAGRRLLLGAIFANLAAALFWMILVVTAAWSMAAEAQTRYGMLLLSVVVAGRVYTTWLISRRIARVVPWSIGSNVVGLLVMLGLVAFGTVEAVLVFPLELVAAVSTYLSRDLMA